MRVTGARFPASEYVLYENLTTSVKIALKRVRYKGGFRWKIQNETGDCLSKDGMWVPEPQPSDRTDEFCEKCRWDSDDDAIDFWDGIKKSIIG